MGNCLVTKLKESINDNNLEKLNTLRLKVVGNSSTAANINKIIIWTHSANATITPIGGGGISLTDGNFSTNPIQLSNTVQNDIYVENTDFYLDISDKYDIYGIASGSTRADNIVGGNVSQFKYNKDNSGLSFNCVGTVWDGDINGFINATDISIDSTNISGSIDVFTDKSLNLTMIFGCTNITGNIGSLSKITSTSLSLYGSNNIGGNISGLIANTSLNTINFRYTKVSGSMSDLGLIPNLAAINIINTNISGSVESFVASRRSINQSTGSINLLCNSDSITFNGQSTISVENNTLSWTASTITFNGQTINA